jgi:hypothetical protein
MRHDVGSHQDSAPTRGLDIPDVCAPVVGWSDAE